ncbi:MAG: DUF3786 domain-containing protein [Oscillospiraceae bacterium]|nr:DUF3786 domain-containing protein [Oscillospiraceae bacterium]
MQIVNNKTENPLKYYREKTGEFDPNELSLKSGVQFDGKKFHLTVMGRPVSMQWPELICHYEDDGKETSSSIIILMTRLVMYGVLSPSSGKMLSYIEIPWGAHYFKAFKGRCLDRLSGTYGHNAKKLASDGAAIGAKEAEGGDCTIEFDFIPGLTVRASVWEGDEEFPANSQITFSDNFLTAFAAEEIAVVGDTFMNALKGRW